MRTALTQQLTQNENKRFEPNKYRYIFKNNLEMNPILVFWIIFPIFCSRHEPSKTNLRKKIAENWAIDGNKNVNLKFDNRLWVRSGIHEPEPVSLRSNWSVAPWQALENFEIQMICYWNVDPWVRLQLCNAKTCQKCAKISIGYGTKARISVCHRFLNYKNCCSRTSILTRGFK